MINLDYFTLFVSSKNLILYNVNFPLEQKRHTEVLKNLELLLICHSDV